MLFGDECRRRRPRRCVSRFHPLSFCLSLSVCLSLSLCLVRCDDLNCATLGFPAQLKCICRIKISRNKLMILKKKAALVISTEKSQTLLGIIESFNDTRMVAFFMFGMKSNALRCVLCKGHFKNG